jgi:MYXO-CTERM domain-containing protein
MKALVLAGMAFVALTYSSPARACGAPGNYETSVDGNTVRVLAMRPCSAGVGDVLLRQDVVSGAVMRVDAACVGGWYVDSCVAPGTYRYGFATPYATTSDCACGPYDYYGVATVDAPLTCPSSDIGVTQVPWADQKTICTPETACNDLAPGAKCEPTAPGPNAGGCAVAPGAARPWWVLVVGLLLLGRRRIMR